MSHISHYASSLAYRTEPVSSAAITAQINSNAHKTEASQLMSTQLSGSVANGATQSPGDNSGISSTDFLTLLVSELKNQDPTQPTDPNAYVQQLVGVNSLQQLIQINQDLTGAGQTTPGLHVNSATEA